MFLFNTKFFCCEAKFFLVNLGMTNQYPGEDLDVYVKKFYQRTMDCSDPVVEEVLVDVCLHGMLEGYRAFLENLSFPSSFCLMKAAPHTNKSIKRILRSSSANLGSRIPKMPRKGRSRPLQMV